MAQLGISWKKEPVIFHHTLKRLSSGGLGHEDMAEHETLLKGQEKTKKRSVGRMGAVSSHREHCGPFICC